MRQLARLSVVTASAVALFGAMSGVSYAWTQPLSLCDGSGNDAGGVDCHVRFYTDNSYLEEAGIGYFTAYGEHLTAKDSHADGFGVYAQATWAMRRTVRRGVGHRRFGRHQVGEPDVPRGRQDHPQGMPDKQRRTVQLPFGDRDGLTVPRPRSSPDSRGVPHPNQGRPSGGQLSQELPPFEEGSR